MPQWSEIFDFKSLSQLALIVVLLVGGFSYLYFNPSQQSQFQSNTLDRLKIVEAKYDALLNENQNLKHQISTLQLQYIHSKSIQESYPWPAWTKDEKGTVIYANQAYVDWYLTPRGYTLFDYVGKTDYAVWSKDIAQNFRSHDLQVFTSGKPQIFTEKVESPNGQILEIKFLKYVRKVNNIPVGVAGMFLPIEENLEKMHN